MSRRKNRYCCNYTENKSIYENKNIYKVGIYARVSVDNKDNSIGNQIELAKEYLESIEDNYKIINIYIDKGISGKNFERKSYIKMMEDIDSKKINCIIVKDISRIGRNYLEVSKAIENDLYIKGIRVIAINDNYDNKYSDDYMKNNLMLHNLINEIYIKDTGNKIRKSKEYLKQKGAYTGVYAPYGYKIVGKGANRVLTKDKESYEIIKYICTLFKSGYSYTHISKILYCKRVNTKEDYRKSGNVYGDKKNIKIWSVKSIIDVLKKEEKECI